MTASEAVASLIRAKRAPHGPLQEWEVRVALRAAELLASQGLFTAGYLHLVSTESLRRDGLSCTQALIIKKAYPGERSAGASLGLVLGHRLSKPVGVLFNCLLELWSCALPLWSCASLNC